MSRKLAIFIPFVTATAMMVNISAQAQSFYNDNAGHVRLEAEALYWVTNFSNDVYALAFDNTVQSFGTNHGRPEHVEGEYDWGYRLSLGYLFPCTNNDIALKYTYFHDNSSAHTTANAMLEPLNIATILTDADASGRMRIRHDAVALQVGHHFSNCGFNFNLFSGLEYARFDNSLHSTIQGSLLGAEIIDQFNLDNSFHGVGPQLGVAGDYLLGCGFGVTGSLSTALLVGNPRSTERVTVFDVVTETIFINQSRTIDKDHYITPHLDGTLGLSYQFCFNCNRSSARIEAGYEANHFFNVTPTVTEDTGNEKYYDISFSGPYLKVQVTI